MKKKKTELASSYNSQRIKFKLRILLFHQPSAQIVRSSVIMVDEFRWSVALQLTQLTRIWHTTIQYGTQYTAHTASFLVYKTCAVHCKAFICVFFVYFGPCFNLLFVETMKSACPSRETFEILSIQFHTNYKSGTHINEIYMKATCPSQRVIRDWFSEFSSLQSECVYI